MKRCVWWMRGNISLLWLVFFYFISILFWLLIIDQQNTHSSMARRPITMNAYKNMKGNQHEYGNLSLHMVIPHFLIIYWFHFVFYTFPLSIFNFCNKSRAIRESIKYEFREYETSFSQYHLHNFKDSISRHPLHPESDPWSAAIGFSLISWRLNAKRPTAELKA